MLHECVEEFHVDSCARQSPLMLYLDILWQIGTPKLKLKTVNPEQDFNIPHNFTTLMHKAHKRPSSRGDASRPTTSAARNLLTSSGGGPGSSWLSRQVSSVTLNTKSPLPSPKASPKARMGGKGFGKLSSALSSSNMSIKKNPLQNWESKFGERPATTAPPATILKGPVSAKKPRSLSASPTRHATNFTVASLATGSSSKSRHTAHVEALTAPLSAPVRAAVKATTGAKVSWPVTLDRDFNGVQVYKSHPLDDTADAGSGSVGESRPAVGRRKSKSSRRSSNEKWKKMVANGVAALHRLDDVRRPASRPAICVVGVVFVFLLT